MSPDLIGKILALKPSERLQIVDLIYNSLDKADHEIEHIWADEAERRLKAIQAGDTRLIPAEQILGPCVTH